MFKAFKQIMQRAASCESMRASLTVIVAGIRQLLETQACSIYLTDRDHQEYVLVATEGLNPEAVGVARVRFGEGLLSLVADREETINLEDAAHHPHFLRLPFIQEEQYNAFLASPIIYHRRVLGILVVQQSEARCFDESEEAMLVTFATQLAGFIAEAEAAGELRPLWGDETRQEDRLFTGIPTVSGVALGRGVVIYPPADLDAVPSLRSEDIDNDILDFETAVQSVRDEIVLMRRRLSPQLPEEELSLFDAYLQMLDPESLGDEVIAEIREGEWSQGALRKVVKRFVARFEAMDNAYMRERASDVVDIGRRVLTYLQRQEQGTVHYPKHTVLVGEQISAANVAEVPEGRLVGIVSGSGSRSSHVAILAKALNVPTVMGVMNLSLRQLDDADLIVDGYYGQVYLSPSAVLRQEYQRLADEEDALDKELESLMNVPAETLDGHRIALLVNTGLATDVGAYLSSGAEGVGLYRSEIPFLTRDRFPSSEEQRVIYRQLLSAFSPREVVMRVLDIGGDKPLPYFPVAEENPCLGWRGIRILLDHPDIFLLQVRAMLRASDGLSNLKIMLPMISDVSEVDDSRRLIERAYEDVIAEGYDIQFPAMGVMIEVPAAVSQARHIASRVDFLSVGSNDLTQYLLAVDRNNARVANLYDWLHPAVLRALQDVVHAAHAEGKPASICGEMAADPMAVLLLVGMGFDALSMHANSVPRMKWLIRRSYLSRAQQVVKEVLAMESVLAIHEHMENLLEDMGLGGLIRAGR